ncbi:iron-sulfur cluster assembly protein [Sedimentitalea todarodis]|uniref:Iron-sulfur cluster assembly protein n=1 Tax=Sedimentitalea todarodis TaxID=1631240 RepID=A0ABU3VE48_9RHOB|nr:iron-sulfur cluster assembly protein [Sedimentitalea todarodis]MDU9004459.1 iron-sulfur cluster assembly protein [Sedimentitalea todarodis]
MFLKLQETEQANAVWECLEHVTDPELDEPVTDMGFIERISVDPQQKRVEVEFRLPTYWCSPNFAFLMAFDIRSAVSTLPWVNHVNVTLNDHCFADRVNDGVNGNHEFSDVFADYCDGENLDAVRLKFLEKAFIRRQETVLLGLEAKGYSGADIVNMTLETLDAVHFTGCEEAKQKPRYRSLLVSRGLATGLHDPAFVTWEGDRLTIDGLRGYLATLRGVRINMEFSGALCRGLQSTRYKEVEIGKDGPTLIDFILHRVPPKGAGGKSGVTT